MKKEASTNLPTRFGNFLVNIYTAEGGQECLAIIAGRINTEAKVAVRVHSACLTAEVLSSLKCDCKSQLDYALNYISEVGGVVLYLPQEGRSIGLINKIRAYSLQEKGYDTVDANRALGLPDDARTYNGAAAILSDLGINKVRLITNNPSKVSALIALGIDVCERIPLPLMPNKHSTDYLETKRKRMGHLHDALDPKDQPEILNSGNLKNGARDMPLVHLNFALNCEGKTASDSGQALPLSCHHDWQRVHELREQYSAVVVGARTWRLDQPQLTARKEFLGREPRRQPDRVIFAGKKECTFIQDSRRTFIIGNGPDQHGGMHIKTTSHSLAEPLRTLYQYGVDTILVEGGLTLLRSFFRERYVDKLTIFVNAVAQEQASSSIALALPEISQSNMQCHRLGDGFLFSSSESPID